QNIPGIARTQHPVFPQQKINDALREASEQATESNNQNGSNAIEPQRGVLNLLKMLSEWRQPFNPGIISEKIEAAPDTVFVGDVPNDTLVISGNWTNNGPVFVFNDGVLIFQNANATIVGNMYVFQGGKIFADSSTLFFPQQYFYQRSLIVADTAFAQFDNCSFNYGGYSHNLVAAG